MPSRPKSWGSIRSGCGTTSFSASIRLSRSSNSLTLLAAVAARTTRIKLGTGVLVLPLRNPVVLAKELSSLDLIAGGRLLLGMASGWYKREFDAVGVPFNERGRIMDRNLEILRRSVDRGAGRRRVPAASPARLQHVSQAVRACRSC